MRDLQGRHRKPYPFCWVHIKILNLAVAEKARKTDAIIGQMRFLAENGDVISSFAGVVLQNFFAYFSHQ